MKLGVILLFIVTLLIPSVAAIRINEIGYPDDAKLGNRISVFFSVTSEENTEITYHVGALIEVDGEWEGFDCYSPYEITLAAYESKEFSSTCRTPDVPRGSYDFEGVLLDENWEYTDRFAVKEGDHPIEIIGVETSSSSDSSISGFYTCCGLLFIVAAVLVLRRSKQLREESIRLMFEE